MGQFEVYSSFPGDFTLISNRFLEDYMPKANGEFVKSIFISWADARAERQRWIFPPLQILSTVRKTDILRALRYWKESGIMDVSFDQAGM